VSELARIADQLQRAYRGEAWHGPSIREVLDGVDADAASARPVSNAHTIKELVVHVVVWEQEALARLAGKGRDDLPPEEDWPAGAPAWADLLDELDAAHERLTSAIYECSDEGSMKPWPEVQGRSTTFSMVSSNITSTTPDRWPFSRKRLQ